MTSLPTLQTREPFPTLRIGTEPDLRELKRALDGPGEPRPLHLVVGPALDTLPDAEVLDRLMALGLCRVTVEGARPLNQARPAGTLAFLRFLRDASACGIPVQWQGPVRLGSLVRLLSHLAPPLPDTDPASDAAVALWREEHAFPRLFYRLGPGFLLIEDTRPVSRPCRLILDDSPSRRVFLRLQQPTELRRLDARELGAARQLIAEGVIMQLDDLLLALAYRLRPIAYDGLPSNP